jgi:1-acyl-sn-glycerol-3-phosphate acyltransferase
VEGQDHVPPEGGVILACTHESHLDPMVLGASLRRKIGFVGRSTLFRNPIFGWLIHSLGARSFDREGPGGSEVKGVIELLEQGEALVFFPEGTRSPDGELHPLKAGIALLARRAGVPVVPIAVDGTFKCWPRHRKLPGPGRIRIVCGEPVRYGPRTKKGELLSDLTERLASQKSRARELA